MESKKFQKRVEDFVCERCGAVTVGKGYTNHCARCLWSKHVDEKPGDRMAVCRGMLEPVSIEKRKNYIIYYRCRTCGKAIKNKAAPEDNTDVIIMLSANPIKK